MFDFTRGWSKDELAAFPDHARQVFDDGSAIGNEFYAKLQERGLSDAEARRVLRPGSMIYAYRHRGQPRLGFGDSARELVLIAGLTDPVAGGIMHSVSIFGRPDPRSYLRRQDSAICLWPGNP